MAVTHSEVKRFSAIAFILILVILSFLVVRPILISIVTGLILAYAFNPLYLKISKYIKSKDLAALTVGILVLIIILVPLWFLIPLLIEQVFTTFNSFQQIDVSEFVSTILPIDSSKLRIEVTNMIVGFIGKMSSSILGGLSNLLFELPTLLMHLAVVIFVFYFALRDQEKLRSFVSGLSPLRKEKEKALVKQFKDVTSSIVFGFIVVGIIQGVATGIGLLVFGIPNALLLTLLAVLASIIPLIGPWLVWVPAAIYLLYIGNTTSAILFAAYCGIVVSMIDNILRPYIVARRTSSSSVIVLVGMIGGLFPFGVLGLILGPLILSYLIVFMEAYKNRTLSDMFAPD